MKKKKENLLIIISTDNIDSILKFPLLYGGVSIPRGYWKRVHIMFWGASIKTVISKKKLRKKIIELQKANVEFSSCIVCAEEYKAVKKLEKINVPCVHTGELLNEALQNDRKWATLTV
jgi:hypothetical protein